MKTSTSNFVTIVLNDSVDEAAAEDIHFHVARPNTSCPDNPFSLAARGGNLAKIPPNQVIADFGRGSSVESESE